MTEYLVFILRGVMQSWGSSSSLGVVRDSMSHPGRSGVAGLLASALGIRRSSVEELRTLHHSVRLAVRQDLPGFSFLDYHTTQVPKSVRKVVYNSRREELIDKGRDVLSTILSEREYMAESAYTCCVWLNGDAGHTLERMAEALNTPGFTLYLGRKSCPPSHPLLPRLVEAENIAHAFGGYDTKLSEDGIKLSFKDNAMSSTVMRIWSDEGHGVDDIEGRTVRASVNDVLDHSSRRHFSMRTECQFALSEKEVANVHE